MPSSFLSQVREALREENGPTLSAPGLAKRLFCSESTLHRKLRKDGTSFSKERNLARARVALVLLRRGYPVEQAGRRVGVTPDHLRVVMQDIYGISPERIKLAEAVARRLLVEPKNRQELIRAKRDDRLLQELLEDIGPAHPLNGWARGLVLSGHHPERDTVAYQEELREKERAAYARKRDQEEAEVVMAMSIDELDQIDVGGLLAERDHRADHMRWRANQLRRTRSAGGAS